MITLSIIAVVLCIIACILEENWHFESGRPWIIASLSVLGIVIISLMVSLKTPSGYTKIDKLAYMTEAGYVETIKGDFFSDGQNYYRRELGESKWIPFAPCEYVKVTLPNANGSQTNESTANYCTECGNSIGSEDKFCAGCGTALLHLEAEQEQ